MDKVIVESWEANKEKVRAAFEAKHPDDYASIVRLVVENVTTSDKYGECNLDPKRITQIDHGDYQGTLLFVIAATGYQPSDYWFVKISYGSCSGCDTLQAIRNYESGTPSKKQVDDYMTLALHIVQGIKSMQESK